MAHGRAARPWSDLHVIGLALRLSWRRSEGPAKCTKRFAVKLTTRGVIPSSVMVTRSPPTWTSCRQRAGLSLRSCGVKRAATRATNLRLRRCLQPRLQAPPRVLRACSWVRENIGNPRPSREGTYRPRTQPAFSTHIGLRSHRRNTLPSRPRSHRRVIAPGRRESTRIHTSLFVSTGDLTSLIEARARRTNQLVWHATAARPRNEPARNAYTHFLGEPTKACSIRSSTRCSPTTRRSSRGEPCIACRTSRCRCRTAAVCANVQRVAPDPASPTCRSAEPTVRGWRSRRSVR